VAPKPSSRESRQRLAGSVSFKPGLEIEKFNENSVSFIMSKTKVRALCFFWKKMSFFEEKHIFCKYRYSVADMCVM
jgi:hypothetical protein